MAGRPLTRHALRRHTTNHLQTGNFWFSITLEQFQIKSDRKAILELTKLLAFLVWSISATADDALEVAGRIVKTPSCLAERDLCPSQKKISASPC
jgi:hypothetical protein